MATFENIVYASGGSAFQSLDLYLPPEQDKEPPKELPLVIWIHGGAFMSGDKAPCPARFLVQSGFAVASLNYRLTEEACAPAQIEDCKAAIRFLRAHAGRYGLDSARFGVWGESAGGFLAALVGTTGSFSRFATGDFLDLASGVQAVCDWYGPTDFSTLDGPADPADLCLPEDRWKHFGPDSPSAAYLGQPIEQDLGFAFASSPVAFVTSAAPPFLIVHGDEDGVIPLGQSRQLAAALYGAGAEAKFVILTKTGHGGGLFDSPEAASLVAQFFQTHLSSSSLSG